MKLYNVIVTEAYFRFLSLPIRFLPDIAEYSPFDMYLTLERNVNDRSHIMNGNAIAMYNFFGW